MPKGIIFKFSLIFIFIMTDKDEEKQSDHEDTLAQIFKSRLNAAFTNIGIIPHAV